MKNRYLLGSVALSALIAFTSLPSKALPISEPSIRYEYAKGELELLCTKLIEDTKSKIEEIKKIPSAQRNFKNTIQAYEAISADYMDALFPLTFMGYTSTNEDTNSEGSSCEEKSGAFGASLMTDHALYIALKEGKPNPGNPIDDRLAYQTLLSFEKNGMNLPEDQLKKVSALMTQLSKLQAKFSENLNKDKSTIEVTKAGLKGVPEDYINSLTINSAGKYSILVKSNSYEKIMENAVNPETRKMMLSAWNNRAGVENTKLLEEAILVREQIAHLIGFKTWADYQINGRMATDSKTVLEFLNSLKSKLAIKNEAILKRLLAEKRKENRKARTIDAWDPIFYINQVKKNEFKVDSEAIAEYFPADTVVNGMFDIYATLFSVRFEELKDAKVWADGVKKYKIIDATTNKVRAYFYADFFPRKGKYGHFAAFPLISGRTLSTGEYSLPVASIVGNFPTPQGGKPALLPHDSVETLFHEFGHIMHQTLTTVPYASLSGSSVLQDFVEAPSQMLENWVWNADVLQRISGHYKDPSQKLPDEMIAKMIAAQTFDAGYVYTRQLVFGLFDMNIHSQQGAVDVNTTFDQMYRQISRIRPIENNHFPASFGHLMGGYDAGYYGYLWSKVYAQDMFTRFEKEGLVSPSVGAAYRDLVLSQGNARNPMELLEAFLGRKPNLDAFYKSLGL